MQLLAKAPVLGCAGKMRRQRQRGAAMGSLVAGALTRWICRAVPPPTRAPPATAPRVRLRDGRRLAYAESGVSKDDARFNVVFSHGFTGSRLDTVRPTPNGRKHITSSKNEVSRDLVVNVKSKKKQALLDVLTVVTKLRHALDMQMELETFVEKENYFQAFQLLPEYLQILEKYSGLSAVQEMGRGIEGYGSGTGRATPTRSVKSAALDVEELADALGLGPKFYVIGISLGCHAIWGALKYIPGRLVSFWS